MTYDEYPLYLTVKQAVELSGFSRDTIRAATKKAVRPLPHVPAEGKQGMKINKEKMREYFESLEVA